MPRPSVASYFPESIHSSSSYKNDSGKAFNPLISSRKTTHAPSTTASQINPYNFPSIQQKLNPRPSTSYSKRPNTSATVRRAPPPKRIMAITEGRGVAVEVGLCIFDVNCCEAVISQVVFFCLNLKRCTYKNTDSRLTNIYKNFTKNQPK